MGRSLGSLRAWCALLRLHPAWESDSCPVPPSDTPCGSFQPRPQSGHLPGTHPAGLWATLPHLWMLSEPHRTQLGIPPATAPASGFSLVWLSWVGAVTLMGGTSHSTTARQGTGPYNFPVLLNPPGGTGKERLGHSVSPSSSSHFSLTQSSRSLEAGSVAFLLFNQDTAFSPPEMAVPTLPPGLELLRVGAGEGSQLASKEQNSGGVSKGEW